MTPADPGYADPTAWTAIRNVDAEREARAGINPDAALHTADTYLPPIEYAQAEEERTAYMRDKHGHRESIAPYYHPAWTRHQRTRPLTNTEIAAIIRALAPRLRSTA